MRPGRTFQVGLGAQQRRERARDDDGTHHVDVELPAIIVQRHFERRSGHRDARVIDEARKPLTAKRLTDLSRGCENRRLVRHIEQQRNEIRAELTAQPLGIVRSADTAEHAKALADENLRGVQADSRGSARDDH